MNLCTSYQLRIRVLLADVWMSCVDLRKVVIDRKSKEGVTVSTHQIHFDLVSDVELFPGDGDNAESK